MRLVTFQDSRGGLRAGAATERGVIDLAATDPKLPNSIREVLTGGDSALEGCRLAAANSKAVIADRPKLRAPIPHPPKVICVGLNYKDHAAESGAPIPREPVIFNKFPTAVIGPDDDIVLPRVSTQVDYEAELVVVIGKRGRNIASSGMEYVAGYTVGHDVSARDWQLHKDGKQWLLGKTFDTFAPMGPALVTKDEVADPHALDVAFRLNGETMQNSNTRQMIFPIDELIVYLSRVITLEPGDVLFTGTPPGVGFARKPPVFLKPGDVCEVEIQGLGVLHNRCVAESDRSFV